MACNGIKKQIFNPNLTRCEALIMKYLESKRGQFVHEAEIQSIAIGIFDESKGVKAIRTLIQSINSKQMRSGGPVITASPDGTRYKVDG